MCHSVFYKRAMQNCKYKLEVSIMANYAKTNIGNEGRVELHEKLSLTGAEISVNQTSCRSKRSICSLSQEQRRNLWHSRGKKEKAVIDNETIELTAGDWLRISPVLNVSFLLLRNPASPMSAFRSRKILSVVSPLMMQCCTKSISHHLTSTAHSNRLCLF